MGRSQAQGRGGGRHLFKRETEHLCLRQGFLRLLSGKAQVSMSLHQSYCGESLLCDPIQRQYDGVNGPKTPIEGAESASPREPQSTARTGTQRTHPPASSHAHEHPPQRHPTAAPLAAAARPSWALRIIGARRLMRHGIPSRATTAPIALLPYRRRRRRGHTRGPARCPCAPGNAPVPLHSTFTGGGAATIREPARVRVRGRAALGRRVTVGVGWRRVVPPLA